MTQLTTAILTAANNNIIYINNTSCSKVSTSKDNVSSWNVPWVHHLFESGVTIADAIITTKKIMKSKGLYDREIPWVILIGGDGSKYDIGLQFPRDALIRTSSFTEMSEYLRDQK